MPNNITYDLIQRGVIRTASFPLTPFPFFVILLFLADDVLAAFFPLSSSVFPSPFPIT